MIFVFNFDNSSRVWALDHGLISGFEVGYNFQGVNQIAYNKIMLEDDYSNTLSIKITTGYRIENFKIIGEYQNTFKYIDLDSYTPIQDRFKIEMNYSWGFLTIGFFHWCNHPVVTKTDNRAYYSNSGQRSLYISYYKEF